jgi:enterochelin esterase-like enzyme
LSVPNHFNGCCAGLKLSISDNGGQVEVLSLSVVSWQFLATIFAAALAAWLGWRLAHLLRRRVLAVLVLTVALVLSTAGVASAVNRYFLYLPQFGDVVNLVDHEHNWPSYESVAAAQPSRVLAEHPTGVVVHLHVPDRGSGFGASQALVYLPPQYFTSPERRFPVVYLIHGSPGVPADWLRGGGASRAASWLAATGRPMIVVAPRMSLGWLDDSECVDSPRERVETHLLNDVIPTVDSTLRTARNRQARAIGGMSAGGYCALNLGLRHRELFGTLLVLSGMTAPTHAGGLSTLFGTGPAAAEQVRANSPELYAPALAPSPATRVWLDCGLSDRDLLSGLRRMQATLASRGIDAVLHTRPGSHTFHVWRPALVESLAWAAPTLLAAAR